MTAGKTKATTVRFDPARWWELSATAERLNVANALHPRRDRRPHRRGAHRRAARRRDDRPPRPQPHRRAAAPARRPTRPRRTPSRPLRARRSAMNALPHGTGCPHSRARFHALLPQRSRPAALRPPCAGLVEFCCDRGSWWGRDHAAARLYGTHHNLGRLPTPGPCPATQQTSAGNDEMDPCPRSQTRHRRQTRRPSFARLLITGGARR